jgi:hypothetical protein
MPGLGVSRGELEPVALPVEDQVAPDRDAGQVLDPDRA